MKKIKLLTPIMCAATVLPVVASIASCGTEHKSVTEKEVYPGFEETTAKFTITLDNKCNSEDIKVVLSGTDADLLCVDSTVVNDKVLTVSVSILNPPSKNRKYYFNMKVTIDGNTKEYKDFVFDLKTEGGVRDETPTQETHYVKWNGNKKYTEITVGNYDDDKPVVVEANAFAGATQLRKITFKSNVKTISTSAFEGLTNLKEVVFEEGTANDETKGVSSIGENAFYGCTSIEKIKLPSTIRNVYKNAFYGCTNLKEVIFPEVSEAGQNNINIYETAFSNCENLTTLHLTSAIGKVEKNAFEYCTSLKQIVLPTKMVAYNWTYAFDHCTSLVDITLPDDLTVIPNGIFNSCTSLKEIKIPETVTTIGSYAFQNCESLGTINIPNAISTIGTYAFNGCVALTSLSVPNTCEGIGNYAFAKSGLTSFSWPTSTTTINKGVFSNCSSLESVTNISSVTQIGDNAFEYCVSLESIELPTGMTQLGDYSFQNCSNLTSLVIPNCIKYETGYGLYAFQNSGLASVTFNASTTQIPSFMFYNCKSLQSVIIPDGATLIGQCAFVLSGVTSMTMATGYTWTNRGVSFKTSEKTPAEIAEYITNERAHGSENWTRDKQ